MSTRSDREICERWFVRQGLPHLIHGYSVTEDVLTRAAPFLGFVVFGQFFFVFGDRWQGWSQGAIFITGLAVVVAAVILVNRVRGRRALQLPDSVAGWELLAYFGLTNIFAALGTTDALWETALYVTVFNAILLASAYVVTSWGLVPMFRWSLGQLGAQIGQVSTLFIKSMPILLLFSIFMFINAEMWQVAYDFTLPYFGLVALLLAMIGLSFVAVSVKRLAVDLARFTAWKDIRRHCQGTPVDHLVPDDDALPPNAPAMNRSSEMNVRLLLFVAQGTQILLVTVIVAAFYLLFGLFTVREETVMQWTTATELTRASDWALPISLWGEHLLFSRPLVLVAGFIGLVSGLQFGVSLVTDASYRHEFAEDMTEELRQALAVRAVYHRVLVEEDR